MVYSMSSGSGNPAGGDSRVGGRRSADHAGGLQRSIGTARRTGSGRGLYPRDEPASCATWGPPFHRLRERLLRSPTHCLATRTPVGEREKMGRRAKPVPTGPFASPRSRNNYSRYHESTGLGASGPGRPAAGHPCMVPPRLWGWSCWPRRAGRVSTRVSALKLWARVLAATAFEEPATGAWQVREPSKAAERNKARMLRRARTGPKGGSAQLTPLSDTRDSRVMNDA
jgi:hypothetical protein